MGGTLTVSNPNDNGAGSLRQAIQDAVDGDTINFSVVRMIALTNGPLPITNRLSIIGPGLANLAISGGNSSRLFEIRSNAVLIISGLTIRDGRAPDGTPRSEPFYTGRARR